MKIIFTESHNDRGEKQFSWIPYTEKRLIEKCKNKNAHSFSLEIDTYDDLADFVIKRGYIAQGIKLRERMKDKPLN